MGPWARRSTHTCSSLLFERSGVHLAKRCPARSTVRDVLDLPVALCAYSDGRDAHRQAPREGQRSRAAAARTSAEGREPADRRGDRGGGGATPLARGPRRVGATPVRTLSLNGSP